MEDKTPSATPPPPAARTAQALRELHDRARTALSAQRERMSRLETQLTEQLDTIALTLAEQIAAHGGPASQTEEQSSLEVEGWRRELEKARAAWETEREALAAAAANRTQLLDERATELNHQDRELRQRQELLDAYAAQCAAQQSQLTATESALDKQRADVAEREAAIQSSQAELERARNELAAREKAWQEGQAALSAEREAISKERESVEVENASLDAKRSDIAAQLDNLANARESTHDELAVQLTKVDQLLTEEREAWQRERAAFEEQRRLLAKERDELATALDAARNELATARAQAGAAAERDELQQKFELALEDVQRLRGRVAELEQELASRPEADQSESVELVHLRAERDAMAERIAELEQPSAAPVDTDAAQEMADLQRRFELAVEDVRDLKKKNSQLEAQLAAASQGAPAPSPSGGGGNWEAMKKRMLANLADEGDDVDSDRAKERATIESTIRITDEAMALKDREIAELRAELAEKASAAPAERDQNEEIRQLVDADAVIAEHRARIAKLEEETNEKLRAAELELSVERAKIAREQVHLAELRSDLQSQRVMNELASGTGGHTPKRRWLSKLGLGGDEETE